MDICQECYAIVPENHTRCADCGAPVVQGQFSPLRNGEEVSPLRDLDTGLDPDDFLRELLGGEQAGRPYFTPNQAKERDPVAADEPLGDGTTAFDPTAYPPPLAEAAVPVVPPPPPAPTQSDLDEILSARPKRATKPAPIAPHRAPAQSESFVGLSDSELSLEAPSFSKSGAVGSVYAVTARSNRLDKTAKLGRLPNHGLLVGAATALVAAVFAIGSVTGWLASNRVPADQGLPAAVAFSDENVFSAPIFASFVTVRGAYCDGTPATGFVTSGVVLISAHKDLTGAADIGTALGTTEDGRFLVIKPYDTDQPSLLKGKSGKIPDGRTVYVVDSRPIASDGDVIVAELEVLSSQRTRGGSFTTYFTDTDTDLPAGMPILDEAGNLIAIVDRSGTFAKTLGPLATELSSLKLSPLPVRNGCVPVEPASNADTDIDAATEGE